MSLFLAALAGTIAPQLQASSALELLNTAWTYSKFVLHHGANGELMIGVVKDLPTGITVRTAKAPQMYSTGVSQRAVCVCKHVAM